MLFHAILWRTEGWLYWWHVNIATGFFATVLTTLTSSNMWTYITDSPEIFLRFSEQCLCHRHAMNWRFFETIGLDHGTIKILRRATRTLLRTFNDDNIIGVTVFDCVLLFVAYPIEVIFHSRPLFLAANYLIDLLVSPSATQLLGRIVRIICVLGCQDFGFGCGFQWFACCRSDRWIRNHQISHLRGLFLWLRWDCWLLLTRLILLFFVSFKDF